MKNLIKTKTFYAGIGLIVSGITFIASGNKSEGIQSILTGIATIFMRDAIRKNDN